MDYIGDTCTCDSDCNKASKIDKYLDVEKFVMWKMSNW